MPRGRRVSHTDLSGCGWPEAASVLVDWPPGRARIRSLAAAAAAAATFTAACWSLEERGLRAWLALRGTHACMHAPGHGAVNP
jgi:hypothetical protein